jgi:alkyl hydroperoxide reductase subunit AhpF
MSLLSDADRQQVRDLLSQMTGHVVLRFYTQAIGCDTCPQTKEILDLLVELGAGRLSIDERNLVLDVSEQDEGVDRAPTVWVMGKDCESDDERDEGIRFVGAPLGYEFTSLLDAILLVSTRETGLSDASLALLQHVTSPMDIQVFTTPT